VADGVADRLRGLLGSDVYSSKGRLRADDLLVRDRACRSLSEATARLRSLSADYRATQVPPSTRENPFPPVEVMMPLRWAERLGLDIDETATTIRGLPLLPEDKVWDRVRHGGLEQLVQFDWWLVCEAEALAGGLVSASQLSAVDEPAVRARLTNLATVVRDRRHYTEVII